MEKPKTKKQELVENIFGHKVSDPYRWLENTESSEVQSWLKEQDKYTRSVLDVLPNREKIRTEFEKLFRVDGLAFPVPKAGRYFFRKRKADEDDSVLYVKEGINGNPRVLLDPNKISKENGSPVHFNGYSISKDGKFISYSISESSNDQSFIGVMNVDTGEILPDKIPGELYPSTGYWAINNSGFWYRRRPENVPKGEEKFHRKIYFHRLGTDFPQDELVFESPNKEAHVSSMTSGDGRFLGVHVHEKTDNGFNTESIYLLDLKNKKKEFMPVVNGMKADYDLFFNYNFHREFIYINTNLEAPNGMIYRVKTEDAGKGIAAWEVVIPNQEDAVIEEISLIGDKLFIRWSQNAYSSLREYSLTGKFRREIPLPTLGISSPVIGEEEGAEGFFSFNSFAYPNTIYRIDMVSGEITLVEQKKIDIDFENIEVKQEWFESKDGTRVPMFIVHKKGLVLDGTSPALLCGYGGFGISMTPHLRLTVIPFLEKGGIYVVANLRGGFEFGEKWHLAGMKKNKQNVFDDFIFAAHWLIDKGYTNPERLAISGGSNGGLLVGAAMNQEPKLFKAVVMSVPVSDMLRFHLFHGGKLWVSDYGNPEDEDMLPYLLNYSPYHNVRNGVEYPATYIETADKDDRVHPGHAFKMAARLQEVNKENPVLLRVERNAGHGGAADLTRLIENMVDEWSFLFWQLKIGT